MNPIRPLKECIDELSILLSAQEATEETIENNATMMSYDKMVAIYASRRIIESKVNAMLDLYVTYAGIPGYVKALIEQMREEEEIGFDALEDDDAY